MLTVAIVNLTFLTVGIFAIAIVFSIYYPSQSPLFFRLPLHRFRNWWLATSKTPWYFLVVAGISLLIVFADNIFKIPSISPGDELTGVIVFITLVTLMWSAYESIQLRKESQKQTFLAIKPHLTVTQRGFDLLILKNVGPGIAVDVLVRIYNDNDEILVHRRYGDIKEEDIEIRDFQRHAITGRDDEVSVWDARRIEISCIDIANNSHRFEYQRDVSDFIGRPISIGTRLGEQTDEIPYQLSEIEMPVTFQERSKNFTTHFIKVTARARTRSSVEVHTKSKK